MTERFLPDEAATIAFAGVLAPLMRKGDCLLLEGDLGMGKSTLARALIRARLSDPDMEVPSPTFTLVQVYDGAPPLYHFDLYRLGDPGELIELGLDEALEEGISLIEWPERGEGYLPEDALWLIFAEEGAGRRVRLSGPAARVAALNAAF
ncbi:tRNA (adenosine(37)-N6)-threonylcarbamoyltransferase complex ATPase subunit type 1 TsaE [Martelella endophytica]|uniref:tRNA (adenosine(37)-N6)-threonylcarbamoyltransferase complex ATPase subunit type 1 TsaE n=1 Tax=Martelella endophytica TaxID=1486262 RepID=UPI0005F17ADA|nr:tRNA (adenosine(37)-N6)-threonylcarbamoyltransferase complex ATPase subunit type 1 TsaE [Martelella endophytica]